MTALLVMVDYLAGQWKYKNAIRLECRTRYFLFPLRPWKYKETDTGHNVRIRFFFLVEISSSRISVEESVPLVSPSRNQFFSYQFSWSSSTLPLVLFVLPNTKESESEIPASFIGFHWTPHSRLWCCMHFLVSSRSLSDSCLSLVISIFMVMFSVQDSR